MDEHAVQRALGTLLGRVVTTAPVAAGPEAPLVVTPALLVQMATQIAAIDDSPWRAEFEDGDLVLWLHADLRRNPVRVVLSFDSDDPPSANELAAAAFLVFSREYCTALIARVRMLEALLSADSPQADALTTQGGAA